MAESRKSFRGRVWGYLSGATTLWGLLPTTWQAAITTAATGVTGYFSYQEWGGVTWALLTSSAVFAMTSIGFWIWFGVTRLVSVFERLTVDQIAVVQAILHEEKDGRNKKRWLIKGLTLECHLRNHSPLTLYFKPKRIGHSMAGKTCSGSPKIMDQVSIVPPQTNQRILLATLPDIEIGDDQLIGHIDLEILYGPAKDDLRYLFLYESEPGMSVFINQKTGKGEIKLSAPIKRHLHEGAS